MNRLAFYSPTEVRLWTRATTYEVEHLPVKEGDRSPIMQNGVEVGYLELEQDPDHPGNLMAVTYWHEEDPLYANPNGEVRPGGRVRESSRVREPMSP